MIHTDHVIKRFAEMGARLLVRPLDRRFAGNDYRLDVARDRKDGERFLLDVCDDTPTIHIPEVVRSQRHLVMSIGTDNYLCGHDERHWFAAGIPRAVTKVMDARRSLLPRELANVPMNHTRLTKRHNDVYVRQGEWFFVPTDKSFPPHIIHHNEPIRRSGRASKSHMVQELVRFGGQRVTIHGGKEYTENEWNRHLRENPADRGKGEMRTKNAMVYARGRIKHEDHATIVLDRWHVVYMNGEWSAAPLAFYD